MLHEEIIRLELFCLDRKKLIRNEQTGCYERDSSVFESAARWLDFHGDVLMNQGKFIIGRVFFDDI